MRLREDATDRELTEARSALGQALQRERAAGVSARGRAAVLGAVGGLVAVLTCGFAAAWLDDGWHLSDAEILALRALLGIALLSLFLASAFALSALWPSEARTGDLAEHVPAFSETRRPGESLKLLLEAVEDAQSRVVSTARLLRWTSALFAVGLAAVVAQGAVFALAVNTDDNAPDDPPAELVDHLVSDNAPAVFMHRAERYGPLDPAMFLADARLRWRRPGRDGVITPKGPVHAARIGAGCSTAPSGCAAFGPFLPFQVTRPHRPRYRGTVRPHKGPLRLPSTRGMYLEEADQLHRGQLIADPSVPVFFHNRPARNGTPQLVTYWMFFGFTKPWRPRSTPGHEGDWKRVSIEFDDGAATWLISSRNVRTPWSKVGKTDGHPTVYASLETHTMHTNQATAASRRARACQTCPREPRGRGILWRTWRTPDSLRDVRREAWFGFGGAWGHAGARASESGPLGPTPHTAPR